MGGGGQQQTGAQTTYNAISAYAAPYVDQMLGQGAALTNQPYQAYSGQQNANFTDLQKQSFAGVNNLTAPSQTAQATQNATQATNNLLNTNYQGIQAGTNSFTNPNVAQAYMNPYTNNVVGNQLALLQQQQGQQAVQNQAQATQAGAFGGSRFGLTQGMQNQANQLATNNLTSNAYNTAYNNAQQQFNAEQQAGLQAQQMNIGQQQYGANLGLQANQAALTGANTLSGLGQTQLNQQTGIMGLQNQYGTQQQQQQQNILNTQQQNFNNQLNYPYQQLSYMQGLLSGLPIAQSTTQTYQSPGAQIAQLGAIGLGGLSAYNQFTKNNNAEGGEIKAYKDGGDVRRFNGSTESVPTSPMGISNVRALIANMTPQELSEERQLLLNRQDAQGRMELALVNERLGIADQPANPQQGQPMNYAAQINPAQQVPQSPQGNSIASAVTPQMADQMVQTAANGGIMGFADEGLVPTPEKPRSALGSISDYFYNFKAEADARRKQAEQGKRLLPGLTEPLTSAEKAQRMKVAGSLMSRDGLSGTQFTSSSDPVKAAALEQRANQVMNTNQNIGPAAPVAPVAPANTDYALADPGVSMSDIPNKPTTKPSAGISSTINPRHLDEAVSHVASQTNTDPVDLLTRAKAALYGTDGTDGLDALYKEENDKIHKLIEAQKPKDTKERDMWGDLTNYFASVAANASTPGTTGLGAFAKGMPVLASSFAASAKARKDSEENYNKILVAEAEAQRAFKQGNFNTALAATEKAEEFKNKARELEIQQQTANQQGEYQRGSLSNQAAQIQVEKERTSLYGQVPLIKLAEGLQSKNPNLSFEEAFNKAIMAQNASVGLRTNAASSLGLQKKLADLDANFVKAYGSFSPDSAIYKQQKAAVDMAKQNLINNYNMYGGDEVQGGISSALPQRTIPTSAFKVEKIGG